MPLRRLWNLIVALPASARLFDSLGVADRVRWNLERELAVSTLELLDVIARKGTKLRKPLVSTRIRPSDKDARKPLPMTDDRVRSFFGAAEYTPKPEPGSE